MTETNSRVPDVEDNPPTETRARIPNAEDVRLLLLWPDAGQLLGLSRATTYSAASRGEIPVAKIGRRLYVPVGKLRQMLGLDASGDAA